MRNWLFTEIVALAGTTVWNQKMRSGLTILGIVIGITALVGMTALIRGFDESLLETISEMGPETIFVTQFSGISLMSGTDLKLLLQRPTLTQGDANAIERQAESIAAVNMTLGHSGGPSATRTRLQYHGTRTKQITVSGSTHNYPEIFRANFVLGRFFTETEVNHRRRVVVLGQTPYQALFLNIDPIGKTVRIRNQPYTVIGVMEARPNASGLGTNPDDIAIIPHTAYQKQFGIRVVRSRRGSFNGVLIAAVPHEGIERDRAMGDVEEIMRIRHGLRLDEPNDFELVTQDAVLRLWSQISGTTYLALLAISSIALLVGGIGTTAIMTISIQERTREIGTRKAIGARRRDILRQFLFEAVLLTAIGGMLGIVFGSGIGVGVHYATGFPISMPWWSFALGIGFSATIGIVFGLLPAVRASAMDPIAALRYE